jgi:hypothetical protein
MFLGQAPQLRHNGNRHHIYLLVYLKRSVTILW